MRLKSYLSGYTSSTLPSAGQVSIHLSGHSHRGGVYTLNWDKGQKVANIECKVPNLPGTLGALPGPDKGTRFIVGTTGGPMGKQAVSGWKKSSWGSKAGWVNKEIGGSLLGGWFTRPPSGLVIRDGAPIKYVTAPGHQQRNDLPRLAVMLDYREIMSVAEKEQSSRPIVLDPPQTMAERVGFGRPSFNKGIAVKLSEEIKQLDCLQLDKIKLWVFKPGKANTKPRDGDRGGRPTNSSSSSRGSWLACTAAIKDDKRFLLTGGSDKTLREALVPALKKNGEPSEYDTVALCAFLQIPLKKPAGATPHPEVPWEEVKTNESWVFPVGVARYKAGIGYDEVVRRSEGEAGEIPKWGFLAEHFRHLGYPHAADVIRQ